MDAKTRVRSQTVLLYELTQDEESWSGVELVIAAGANP